MKTETKFMKIYCGECRLGFEMYPDRAWYNFSDESYAHKIGFCSPECCKVYAVRKGWS